MVLLHLSNRKKKQNSKHEIIKEKMSYGSHLDGGGITVVAGKVEPAKQRIKTN